MTERILRAEKVQAGIRLGRGWLTLTNLRLVFGPKEDVGKGEKWTTPLERVESVRAKKQFAAGFETLEIVYRNEKGKRESKGFERGSVAAWSNAFSGTSRAEPNSFAGFETQIIDAREAWFAARDATDTIGPATAAAPQGQTVAPVGRQVPADVPTQTSVDRPTVMEGVEALERLVRLRESGSLSAEEFSAAKAQLLRL